ncbi:septation protein SepH [Georgenia sp. 10Sc9-8]|uniref:Septation protein SepH n=1 Tax=Georgenia halotolerans TaxID=3028317 RepID=A0ABT5U2Y3_9MICO|nr:septation protein SepH [Georgenia halotolerans]
MVELELLGLHSDGEHLTLTDPEGQRYRLLVDDALRAAVRRDRPRLEQLRAVERSAVRPRDIQVLVRAGATAEEVAERAGLPVEHVRRYEGPVLAERQWVVQQAQGVRINHDSDAPQLGDLVVDRLAARGVEASTLQWDAVRAKGEPWEVAVTFVTDGEEHEARWRVDLSARSVSAVDDEARWLSETEVGPGPLSPRRRLTAVAAERRARVFDLEDDDTAEPAAAAEVPAADDDVTAAGSALADDRTDDLLAELTAQRGTRVQPEVEEDAEAQLWGDGPGAHPPASRPEEARDAHVLPLRASADTAGAEPAGTTPALPPAEPAGTTPALPPAEGEPAEQPASGRAQPRAAGEEPRPRKSNRRTNRRSVPSWDEIVFGARPE